MVKHKVSTKWDRFKQRWLATRMGSRLQNIWSYVGWDDYLALVILGIGVLGYVGELIPCLPEWGEFYMDIRSELIGIGFAVLLIANAGEAIARRQEKKRLILQMGSPDNAFAREAARQLKAREWLYDGTLIGANLSDADLSNADLIRADLSEADLDWAILCNADLTKANLRNADLTNANLAGAFLGGADLSEADLSEADLSEADLGWAILCNADLGWAILSRNDLRMAIYNKETKWPEGFDPVAAGAVLTK